MLYVEIIPLKSNVDFHCIKDILMLSVQFARMADDIVISMILRHLYRISGSKVHSKSCWYVDSCYSKRESQGFPHENKR